MCQYGQGTVRGIFEQFPNANLKGFVVWLPMMSGDSLQSAQQEEVGFDGFQATHAWDAERQLGNLYAKTLNLNSVAWDVYLLYAPGITWEGSEPPQPTFWMHQLPTDSGADRDLVLYPTRLAQELLNLLGVGAEPGYTSRADLGLQLHAKALTNVDKERGQSILEEIQQAVEDSKIES